MPHIPIIITARDLASKSVYIAEMAGRFHQRIADGYYTGGNLTQANTDMGTFEDKAVEALEELVDIIDDLEQYFPPE